MGEIPLYLARLDADTLAPSPQPSRLLAWPRCVFATLGRQMADTLRTVYRGTSLI